MVTCINRLLLPAFLLISLNVIAQPNHEWIKQISYGAAFLSEPKCILTDAQGNVYISGSFVLTTDFDPGVGVHNLSPNGGGGSDVFVMKLDANGNFLWVKHIKGTTGDSFVSNAMFDSQGNIYTCGYFFNSATFDAAGADFVLTGGQYEYNPFILKLTPAGDFIWAKQLPKIAAFDANDNMLFTGTFTGTKDFDDGGGEFNLTSASTSGDIFIKKTDSEGNFLWAKQIEGAGNFTYMRSGLVKTDGSNNVIVTGGFKFGTVDLNTGSGVQIVPSDNSDAGLIIKLSSTGEFLWGNGYSATNSGVLLKTLGTDGDGNVYASGSFWGTIDFDAGSGDFTLANEYERAILLKLSASGDFSWAATDNVWTNYNTMTVSSSGDVYAAGQNNEGYLRKYNANGGIEWNVNLNSSFITVTDIAVDSFNNNIYTTGYFKGSIDFDMGAGSDIITQTSPDPGSGDKFIHKMNQLSLLTVQFNNFSVAATGSSNRLQWQFENVANGSFEIEKSKDGVVFTAIGTLVIQNGRSTYSFDDTDVTNGMTYYRIKYIATGNMPLLSKVVSYKRYTGINISIYPNPVFNTFTISGAVFQNAVVRIFNTLMQPVVEYKNISGSSIVIDCNNFPAGVYVLEINDSLNGKHIKKIIKK